VKNCPRLLQPRFRWPLQDQWFTNALLEESNYGLGNIDPSDLMTVVSSWTTFQTSDVSHNVSLYPLVSTEGQDDNNTSLHTLKDSVDTTRSPRGHRPIPVKRSPRSDDSSELSLNSSPQSSNSAVTASIQLDRGSGVDLVRQLQPRHVQETQKKHRCDECSKSYDHPKSLREHKQTKHLGCRYTCPFQGCGKTIAQKKNLGRHMAAKHRSFVNNKTTSTRATMPP
jgi:hypothetical protein